MKKTATIIAGVLLGLLCAGHSARAQGIPHDWSHHHLIFSKPRNAQQERLLKLNPRYRMQQALQHGQSATSSTIEQMQSLDALAVQLAKFQRLKPSPAPTPGSGLRPDWGQALNVTINASTTTVIPIYPAKFSFNQNGFTPSCTNDFVVFTIPNSPKSTSSFNIIGFNQLYTNSTGTGVCAPGSTTTSKANPVAIFDYNASTATGGTLQSSPVISNDATGSEIAFVENASAGNGGAVFHVLRWVSGNTNSYPTPFNNAGSLTDCNINNTAPCEFSVAYTSPAASATLSAPFVDYHNDIAYVGDDNGTIYAISPVFNASQGNPPVVLWSKQVGAANAIMTPPVFDQTSGNVFVGDSNGKVSFIKTSFSTVGTCASGSPPCIGSNNYTFNGKISDAPIVDSSSGSVFMFGYGTPTGLSAGSWIVQLDTQLSSTLLGSASLGSGTTIPIYDGTFDDTYLNGTQASGHLIACGQSGTTPELFQYGFTTSSGQIVLTNTGVVGGIPFSGGSGFACSPLTENAVTTGTPTDRVFYSVPNHCSASITGGCVASYTLPLAVAHTVSSVCSTTNGSATISCGNNQVFSSSDVGRIVTGSNIPLNTTIASVAANQKSATMSQNATGSGTGPYNLFAPPSRVAETNGTTAIVIDNRTDVGGTTTDIFFETQGAQSCNEYGTTSNGTFSCATMLTQSGLQ